MFKHRQTHRKIRLKEKRKSIKTRNERKENTLKTLNLQANFVQTMSISNDSRWKVEYPRYR